MDDLDRVHAGPGVMAPPPRAEKSWTAWGTKEFRRSSSEFDWFDGLAEAERARLRERWFAPSGHGESPDEISQRIDLRSWLDLTRRVDATRALSEGRVASFNPRRYGGLNPNHLIGGAPYNVQVIWGDDERAQRHLDKSATRKGLGRTWQERVWDVDVPKSQCQFRTRPDGTVYPLASTCSTSKAPAWQTNYDPSKDEAF